MADDFNRRDIPPPPPPPETRIEEESNTRIFAFFGILVAVALIALILVEVSNHQANETAQGTILNNINPAAGTPSQASPVTTAPETTTVPETTTPNTPESPATNPAGTP